MAYTFIVSTAHSTLRPLAWQGITAQAAYDQLTHTLLTRLGQEQAAVLAEPVNGQEAVDWYSRLAGTPLPLAELNPDEQETVFTALASFTAQVKELAARLKQEADSNARTAGNLLELTLIIPAPEYVYALRSSSGALFPLLTGWGCTMMDTGQAAADITRLFPSSGQTLASSAPAAAATPSMSASELPAGAEPGGTPEDSAGQTWEKQEPPSSPKQAGQTGEGPQPVHIRHVFPFPWALFAFLTAILAMLFILFWLLPNSGIRSDFIFSGCAREQTAPEPDPNVLENLYRAQGMEQALRDELAYLRQEYALRLLLCKQAEAPEPEPEIVPEPEAAPPLPELVLPELPPDPPPAPAPEKPAPPKAEAKPKPESDTLVIPDNPTDLSFLEGCWYARTGLKSTRTNMPISVKYCFDGQGNGNITLTERDRNGREVQVCRGGAKARLEGGRLYIHDLGARCPGGQTYEREKITCRNADQSKALCTGVGEQTRKTNWNDKPFTRTDH